MHLLSECGSSQRRSQLLDKVLLDVRNTSEVVQAHSFVLDQAVANGEASRRQVDLLQFSPKREELQQFLGDGHFLPQQEPMEPLMRAMAIANDIPHRRSLGQNSTKSVQCLSLPPLMCGIRGKLLEPSVQRRSCQDGVRSDFQRNTVGASCVPHQT